MDKLDSQPEINSRAWWDDNFATRWESNNGRAQTAHFMQRLINSLPSAEREFLSRPGTRILDWGCALGEGVRALADAFPDAKVAGLDFSAEAVRKARESYPDLQFIHSPDGAISGKFDCVVVSNCLEHFDDPLEIVRAQLPSCMALYIAMTPYRERPLIDCHRTQFRDECFPPALDGFARIFAAVVDVDREIWNGEQFLVIYGAEDYLRLQGLSVEALEERRLHAGIASIEKLGARLSTQLEALVAEETRLKHGRHQLLSRLQEELDRLISQEESLRAQRQELVDELRLERDRYSDELLQLRSDLAERDAEIQHLKKELESHASQTEEARSVLKLKLAELNQLQGAIKSSRQEVERLRQRLTDAEQRASIALAAAHDQRHRELRAAREHAQYLGEHLSNAQRRLIEIYNCRGWKLLQLLWWLRLKLVPKNSYRERAGAFFLRTARRLVGRASTPSPPTLPVPPPCPAASVSYVDVNDAGDAAASRTIAGRLPAVEVTGERARTVNILTTTFFNYDGADMYCGGAERYLIELARTIRSMGYRPVVYQCGNQSWTRWYNDVEVHGLPAGGDIHSVSQRFHELVPPAALTIYFAFHLAFPHAHARSLGISHGVWWDHASFQSPVDADGVWLNRIKHAIRNCESVVSVDTNTINWVRATEHHESSKFTYLPNFVDLDVFQPHRRNDGRRVVLFPRRLYGPRGFWLLAELAPRFLEEYPEVDFHFVGKADPKEAEAVKRLAADYPGRVIWRHYEPDDMHQAYAAADITVIPTLNSEGTSLSCLEAMASGNVVIATNVGGLPDLILDGHNGLLIEPTQESLAEALERLLSDRQLCDRLRSKALEVVQNFSKEVWTQRWRKRLAEVLPPQESPIAEAESAWTFVHPRTPGIRWASCKQRPQQIFQALAECGHHAFFVTDDKDAGQPVAEIECPTLHVVNSNECLELTRPVVYISYAYGYLDLAQWANSIVIYDILDAPEIHEASDIAAGRGADNNFLFYHKKLLQEADIVLTSSEMLFERFVQERPDIILVPNAVRAADFQAPPKDRPADLPSGGTKVIGYYGALAEWFDFELLDYACGARPEYAFVLIGVTNQKDKLDALLARHPNLHYLGEKRYEELPAYLACFDVATIPFQVNSITHAVSPVKLFEYFAGGKPVVTTDLRECRKFEPVLRARDSHEFVAQLDKACQLARNIEYKRQVLAIAEENSWTLRARQILDALEGFAARQAAKAASATINLNRRCA